MRDEDTIRNYYARYQDGDLMAMTDDKYVGNKGLLRDDKLEEISIHLDEVTYRTSKEVMNYINNRYETDYSLRGTIALLKRIGFVYKKPQRRPGKCDVKAQEQFIKDYRKVRQSLGHDDRIYFMDTTHPEHQTHVE